VHLVMTCAGARLAKDSVEGAAVTKEEDKASARAVAEKKEESIVENKRMTGKRKDSRYRQHKSATDGGTEFFSTYYIGS